MLLHQLLRWINPSVVLRIWDNAPLSSASDIRQSQTILQWDLTARVASTLHRILKHVPDILSNSYANWQNEWTRAVSFVTMTLLMIAASLGLAVSYCLQSSGLLGFRHAEKKPMLTKQIVALLAYVGRNRHFDWLNERLYSLWRQANWISRMVKPTQDFLPQNPVGPWGKI